MTKPGQIQTPCDRLDDYLDGELAGAAKSAFKTHLAACGACRRAVNETAAVYALVREASLDHPVRPTIVAAKRRRVRLAAAIAFATAASLGAVWFAAAWNAPRAPEQVAVAPAGVEHNHEADEAPSMQEPPSEPAVRITTSADYLAVSRPSSNDQVTIVWTYPIVRGGS